ncbi:ATP-binding protein [uncultured Bacteroides sp.]|uniref:ATP-binding protein n=1 Tax=uncultured Bacteroides sp. TaxID=162156 RepID=UPI0023BDB671|nr:ATP-binding protein [uncultured Bacteroides sp.]MDE5711923.1 ATP-binding protein [Bacteroides sp.]MDE5759588.1 ATP-binding protein [Bacteroides sp.]
MKRLLIKNFGPIEDAHLTLGQVNIITGMQSSGKSCVLKTACYCSWVEKRLELTQKVNGLGKGSTFIDVMADYYKMNGYVQDDTYIEYETRHMKFSYDHSSKTFKMNWKSKRWDYRRPKVSYIPTDRNLVAAIPGWSLLSMDGNMIEFMSDWDKARRFVKREENFLDLGMSYSYDSMSNSDKIRLENGTPLMLRESSSGVQSLLPMYVHLDYLVNGQYKDRNGQISYEQKEERKNLLSTIYNRLKGKEDVLHAESVTLEGYDYSFSNREEAERFRALYNRYINVEHSEIFLEEPENNLFPPTQCKFINWLLDAIQEHDDMLFIATHSPYILNQLIKIAPKDMNVLFTYRSSDAERMYSVKQLTEDEVREIYDNGVDMFFNFELYV